MGDVGLGQPCPRPDNPVGPSRPPNFRPAAARAALPAPWAERSLLRRDKSARSPGTPRELPAPPLPAPPRPRFPGTRTGSRGATPISAKETAEGPRAVCGHSLGSESLKPPPRTAFPDADSHLPKLAAGAAARAPRRRAPGGAATSDPGSRGAEAPERPQRSPPDLRCTPVSPTTRPAVARSAHSPGSRAQDRLSNLRRARNSWSPGR